MADEGSPSTALINGALADVRAAYEHARAVLGEEADPHQAFELATQFADALRALADEAADLRAAAVGRIWENEATSLAGLAQKIGVSKARAAQLMRTARTINNRARAENEGQRWCAD